jgi:hypothetical protein
MTALLVRIGIDQTYGGWNAPVDPVTRKYVYVPIPEYPRVTCHKTMARRFHEVSPSLRAFQANLDFPRNLHNRLMHLDPDFSELTYGDIGSRRGSRLRHMQKGDFLVFYASLRPTIACEYRLLYAMIGLYVIHDISPIAEVARDQWHRNAHTRRVRHGATDIVVRAQPGVSGRLERCIPIGHWRNRSYRLRPDVIEAWGGLSANDGFLQRSAVPPMILNPDKFLKWFAAHSPVLTAKNFEPLSSLRLGAFA